jgi:SnoaL-like domain
VPGLELTDAVWEGADPVSRFALALDARDPARIAQAFTPDGVLHAPDGSEQAGREAIHGYYADRVGSTGDAMHVLNRLSTWSDADGLGHTRCYALIVLGPGPGKTTDLLMTGRYEFVVDPGAGAIARLEVQLDETFELTRVPPREPRSEGNG